jgi:hypothetical protein
MTEMTSMKESHFLRSLKQKQSDQASSSSRCIGPAKSAKNEYFISMKNTIKFILTRTC